MKGSEKKESKRNKGNNFGFIKWLFKSFIILVLFLSAALTIDHVVFYADSSSENFDLDQVIFTDLVLAVIFLCMVPTVSDFKMLLLYAALFSWFVSAQLFDISTFDWPALRDVYCKQSKLIVNLFTKFMAFWMIERCMEA